MSEKEQLKNVTLQAKSPFELRINLGRDIPESDVRTALATGDVGFLHSFTTGSTVDGPGVRVVAWTSGCQFRCLYCHNPDTWNMTNGIPVTLGKATEELRGLRQRRRLRPCVATTASRDPRLTEAELESIDLVLLDIKTWDAERHR